jgi:hypothetical protein
MPTPTDRSGGLQVATPDIDPARYWAAVTKSDATILTGVKGLFIGGAGDVVLTDQNGTDATFTCVAGQLLPVSPKHVKAATTATAIVALK